MKIICYISNITSVHFSIIAIEYIYSNEKSEESVPAANFRMKHDQGLLIMYVSMCNGCILGIKLINQNTTTEIKDFSYEYNASSQWEKVEIPINNTIKNEDINLYVYTNTTTNFSGQFWKIANHVKIAYGKNVTICFK